MMNPIERCEVQKCSRSFVAAVERYIPCSLMQELLWSAPQKRIYRTHVAPDTKSIAYTLAYSFVSPPRISYLMVLRCRNTELHEAVAAGVLDAVDVLVRGGAAVNSSNKHG
jgi:hypothetical protein